jgi:hypothetical protein
MNVWMSYIYMSVWLSYIFEPVWFVNSIFMNIYNLLTAVFYFFKKIINRGGQKTITAIVKEINRGGRLNSPATVLMVDKCQF